MTRVVLFGQVPISHRAHPPNGSTRPPFCAPLITMPGVRKLLNGLRSSLPNSMQIWFWCMLNPGSSRSEEYDSKEFDERVMAEANAKMDKLQPAAGTQAQIIIRAGTFRTQYLRLPKMWKPICWSSAGDLNQFRKD